MVRLIIILFLSELSFLCLSQNVQGIVLDSATQQPLPYVNIYSTKFETGTITNVDGQFILEKKEDNLEINFSHLGYENKVISLKSSDSFIKVLLASKSMLLAEVTVSDEAYKLAKAALTKFMSPQPINFGKAFYRQVSLTGETPVEFIETFNNVSFNSSGLEKYDIYQARYARSKSTGDSIRFFYTNFSFLTFGSHLFSTKASGVVKPFTSDYFDSFTYSIKSLFEIEGIKYAIIEYEPLADLNMPSLFGDFTINLSTGALINYIANTKSNLGVDSVRFNNSGKVSRIPVKNHLFQWVYNFKDNSIPELNYINVTCSLDFAMAGKSKKVKISSTLLVFEKTIKNSDVLRTPDIKQVDIDMVRKSRYSLKFWQDNPIIKRTHFEEEVISYFEKSNSFGNYLK